MYLPREGDVAEQEQGEGHDVPEARPKTAVRVLKSLIGLPRYDSVDCRCVAAGLRDDDVAPENGQVEDDR